MPPKIAKSSFFEKIDRKQLQNRDFLPPLKTKVELTLTQPQQGRTRHKESPKLQLKRFDVGKDPALMTIVRINGRKDTKRL